MELILRQDVENLGFKDDIVDVKNEEILFYQMRFYLEKMIFYQRHLQQVLFVFLIYKLITEVF